MNTKLAPVAWPYIFMFAVKLTLWRLKTYIYVVPHS